MQARTSWLGSSSAEKDLSDVVDNKLNMGLAAKNTDHGLCSEEHCVPGEVVQSSLRGLRDWTRDLPRSLPT